MTNEQNNGAPEGAPSQIQGGQNPEPMNNDATTEQTGQAPEQGQQTEQLNPQTQAESHGQAGQQPQAELQAQAEFQEQAEQPQMAPQDVKPDYAMPLAPKKESGWLKFLRVVIWFAVIMLLSIGAGLSAAATKIASFSDGTSAALATNGDIMFKTGAVIGTLNFIWGAVRWFRRWHRERWRFGKVLGKVIGGGIWRTVVVVPITLFALIFVAPAVARAISKKVVSDAAAVQDTSLSKLTEAFESNKIDANKYIDYLIKAAYDNQALPEEYRDDTKIFMNQVLTKIDENASKLDRETLEKVIEMLTFSNIEFGEDASGNPSSSKSLFAESVFAESKKVQTLNKVIASDNQRFVVFYTDTGSDRISEDDAKRVGKMLEDAIDGYRTEFGLTYHTNQQNFHDGAFGGKRNDMGKLMEANGVSKSLLDSAIPVYIINPYSAESTNLASYVGERWLDTLEKTLVALRFLLDGEDRELVDLYATSPVLPFINILPNNINDPSLALVATHELGHHYASNYCYDNYGKKCGSDNHFVSETFPQIAATLIVKDAAPDNFMTHWHERYVTNSEKPLYDDYLDGYASFAFLYQYDKSVSDGRQTILEALMQEDAYWYLYNHAGKSKMKEILGNLASDNTTNNYGSYNALISSKIPTGESLPCYDMCSVKYDGSGSAYEWKSSTIHYFYFPLSEFKDKVVKVSDFDGESYAFRFLGLKNGKWSEMSYVLPKSTDSGTEYEFGFKDLGEYDTVLMAVADYESADDSGKGFFISVKTAEIEEVVEQPVFDADSFFGTYGNCLWFYTDGLLDAASEVAGVFTGINNDLDQAIEKFQGDAADAKAQVGHRKITLCGVYLDKKADFDDVKKKVSRGWFGFTPVDITEGDSRMALTVNYNPIANRATARWLTKDSDRFAMVTATIE